ncbi:MAG: T9SS type A sorting domain-containing protein [bacterium]|nr:MAG: T9SS type A sorting domain-containing protein [bacterium]
MDGITLYFQMHTGTETPPPTPVLYQNYPNPFNPSTTISYYLPERDRVRITIYDITGMFIVRLENRERPEGHNAVTWDGTNGSGTRVGAGLYLCQLKTTHAVTSRKMILLP